MISGLIIRAEYVRSKIIASLIRGGSMIICIINDSHVIVTRDLTVQNSL